MKVFIRCNYCKDILRAINKYEIEGIIIGHLKDKHPFEFDKYEKANNSFKREESNLHLKYQDMYLGKHTNIFYPTNKNHFEVKKEWNKQNKDLSRNPFYCESCKWVGTKKKCKKRSYEGFDAKTHYIYRCPTCGGNIYERE